MGEEGHPPAGVPRCGAGVPLRRSDGMQNYTQNYCSVISKCLFLVKGFGENVDRFIQFYTI